MDKLWQGKIQWLKMNYASSQRNKRATYSTFFDQSGGLLKVMNTQLVKIVHIMIMLNTVEKSQGRMHQIGEDTKSDHFIFSSESKHVAYWVSWDLNQDPERRQKIKKIKKAQKRRERWGESEKCGPRRLPRWPGNHEWTQQNVHALSERLSLCRSFWIRRFPLLPLSPQVWNKPLNTFVLSNQTSTSLPDSKVTGWENQWNLISITQYSFIVRYLA